MKAFSECTGPHHMGVQAPSVMLLSWVVVCIYLPFRRIIIASCCGLALRDREAKRLHCDDVI
jgi:hypothetical protein